MKYSPPSIQERGLRAYLDSTKKAHGNNGYEDFMFCMSLEGRRSKIAELFHVSEMTVYRWIRIFNKEREK